MIGIAASQLCAEVFARFEPPPEMNCWEWAEEYRVLPKGVTPMPGPYSTELTPWVRDVQRWFHDDTVQVNVLMWGRRMSKTECTLNLQGRAIHLDPYSILVVYPTLDSAKNWSKRFFAPMLKATPVLARKIQPSRSRDADNTVLLKKYPGGHIACIGANSPSGFRQIQAPIVICDEIDAMDDSSEGDPIDLAIGRADNYPNSIIVLSSTPTIKDRSRIEKWFLSGDQQRWFVPCGRCGRMQTIRWENVDFSERGTVEEPRWVCEDEECNHAHTDAERISCVLRGEWRATAPFTGVRSSAIGGLYSTFPPKRGFKTRLQEIVAAFRKAKAEGSSAMRVFVNQILDETFEEEGTRIDHVGLRERVEDYSTDPLPDPVVIITAGVDQQKDRLEAEFIGWGPDEESWGIEYAVIFGDPEKDEVWATLDQMLAREWDHPCGARLKVTRACVDMGDKQTNVLAFCQPRMGRGVFACKGIGRAGNSMPPLLPQRPSLNNKSRTPFWPVGVNAAKIAIYDRLTLAPGTIGEDGGQQASPRACHFPNGRGYDDVYFEQLVAEKMVTKYQFGQAYRIFEKPTSGTRNEALDCRCYGLAALHSLGIVAWGKVRENLVKAGESRRAARPALVETPTLAPEKAAASAATVAASLAPLAPAKPAPVAPLRQVPARSGSGYIGGWRKY